MAAPVRAGDLSGSEVRQLNPSQVFIPLQEWSVRTPKL